MIGSEQQNTGLLVKRSDDWMCYTEPSSDVNLIHIRLDQVDGLFQNSKALLFEASS